MKKEIIENLRQDYKTNFLDEKDALQNPFEMFEKWFSEALKSGIYEPNTMTLATATSTGKPSARMVLLKGFTTKNFIFYTHYTSRKGLELESNPEAALLFFWPELERQIRIGGRVEKIPQEDSITYFHSRPRSSQIGALSSPQSQIIPNREYLDQRLEELGAQFKDQIIPKPETWGGYGLFPIEFEFWQGRSSRLHDRLAYNLIPTGWVRDRLAP